MCQLMLFVLDRFFNSFLVRVVPSMLASLLVMKTSPNRNAPTSNRKNLFLQNLQKETPFRIQGGDF